MASSDVSGQLSPAGRRVIVTGARGGLGRAIVELLERLGCAVAGCDVEDFDIRDRAAVDAGVASLVRRLGGCDAVVANAGIVDTIHRAERFAEAEWHKDVETNLTGTFNVVRALHEPLREAGDGRVVVLSSVSAETGLPGQVAYTATKAGLVGMIRTLAGEWGAHGIRCNVVMPGLVATPKVLALPATARTAISRTLPLRRIGEPAEIAGTIAFLLSPAAAYITGAVIRVDGGYGLNTASLAVGPD
jgi:NAD(P)-dependent dehydrogenase (short-subunit alcohol dehydrogenase family)